MSTIEEKRVFGDRSGDTTVYLATGSGVVRVSVADDRIGEFALEERCTARDLAAVGDALAVATSEDVLFDGEPTGFGPAVAVGGTDAPIAAGPDGRVARYRVGADGDGDHGGEWTDLGSVAEIRAIDGDLLATAGGIYRAGSGLQYVGLEDANDVSTPGVPLAASSGGLYRLGNGWMSVEEGRFDLVSADRRSEPGTLGRACAVGGDRLSVHDPDTEEWHEREPPASPAAVAVGEALYLATEGGRLFVDAGDGWRSQTLGLGGVKAMVVG
jgi:hypothetical protein